MPANDPDACLHLIRIRSRVDNLVVVIVVSLGRRRLDLVGRVRVDKADHEILHACFATDDPVSDLEQRFNRGWEMDHVVLDLVQSVLDALRDLDFALACQQLNRAHLAHVHTHRVGCAAELGVDARQRGLGFLDSVLVGRRRIG